MRPPAEGLGFDFRFKALDLPSFRTVPRLCSGESFFRMGSLPFFFSTLFHPYPSK